MEYWGEKLPASRSARAERSPIRMRTAHTYAHARVSAHMRGTSRSVRSEKPSIGNEQEEEEEARKEPRCTTSSSGHIRSRRPPFSRRRGNCGTHVRAFFRTRPPTSRNATITQRDALTGIVSTGKSSAPLSPELPESAREFIARGNARIGAIPRPDRFALRAAKPPPLNSRKFALGFCHTSLAP